MFWYFLLFRIRIQTQLCIWILFTPIQWKRLSVYFVFSLTFSLFKRFSHLISTRSISVLWCKWIQFSRFVHVSFYIYFLVCFFFFVLVCWSFFRVNLKFSLKIVCKLCVFAPFSLEMKIQWKDENQKPHKEKLQSQQQLLYYC